MVAATLVWTAESGRLREPLAYCHQFGEIVNFQTALKFAYLKQCRISFAEWFKHLESHQIITTKLQVFLNRCLIFHIYWHNNISNMNLLKMADMQQTDVLIGHTLRKVESSVARQTMQWHPLDGIGSRKGRPCETWRPTVARRCKNLNKICSDMKQLTQSRVWWREGVVDALCPGRDQGN